MGSGFVPVYGRHMLGLALKYVALRAAADIGGTCGRLAADVLYGRPLFDIW